MPHVQLSGRLLVLRTGAVYRLSPLALPGPADALARMPVAQHEALAAQFWAGPHAVAWLEETGRHWCVRRSSHQRRRRATAAAIPPPSGSIRLQCGSAARKAWVCATVSAVTCAIPLTPTPRRAASPTPAAPPSAQPARRGLLD